MRRTLFLLATLTTPALADSPDAWDDFRAEVAAACTALVQDPGTVAVEVNPFGSESFGAAIVTVTATYGTDRMICIFDKITRAAELTQPFAPAE
jgi:hypothetical protein